MNRRKFIRDSSLLSTSMMLPSFSGAADSWSGGQLQHLIPLTNHDSLMLKVSFVEPQDNPTLRIGQNSYPGLQTDTLGRFWTFHASGLESDQEYELTLQQQGSRYADSWPIRTAPAPAADSERMRLLVFTCAGGPDDALTEAGIWRYLPVTTRQRLFQRALSLPRIWPSVSATRFTGIRLLPAAGVAVKQGRRQDNASGENMATLMKTFRYSAQTTNQP